MSNEKLRELDNKQLEMELRMCLATVSGYHEECYASQLLITKAMNCITEMADRINTPKHETVGEWEKRTGESYPDDGPVFVKEKQIYGGWMEWKLKPYIKSMKDLHPAFWRVVIATHHGKPEIEE